jgi:hypothetical protein
MQITVHFIQTCIYVEMWCMKQNIAFQFILWPCKSSQKYVFCIFVIPYSNSTHVCLKFKTSNTGAVPKRWHDCHSSRETLNWLVGPRRLWQRPVRPTSRGHVSWRGFKRDWTWHVVAPRLEAPRERAPPEGQLMQPGRVATRQREQLCQLREAGKGLRPARHQMGWVEPPVAGLSEAAWEQCRCRSQAPGSVAVSTEEDLLSFSSPGREVRQRVGWGPRAIMGKAGGGGRRQCITWDGGGHRARDTGGPKRANDVGWPT